ncbi:MAG TPA: hemerythrin domain-containing protein [Stellaceae bacterium]|nr:hemerythrin domain-containing protein [Stellaceae bacterium]
MARLSEVFRRDHQRLEEIIGEVERRVATGEWPQALAGFTSFREAIERHMAVEEQWLFPVAETDDVPASSALTATLRKGHRDLRVFFEELQDALAARDDEEFRQTAATMRELLRLHDEKEEVELYSAVESCLDNDGAAVIARLAGQ